MKEASTPPSDSQDEYGYDRFKESSSHASLDSKQSKDGKEKDEKGIIASFKSHVSDLQVIVSSNSFQYSIIGLIVLNSILMGVTTFDFVQDDEDVSNAFEIVDLVILVIFTIELVLNLIVYNLTFFSDPWRTFDLLTVAMSWAFANVKIIRSFRIFRAFRLFGRVKSLNKILQALFSTGEQMISILFVLFLIFYIFGVMFTQLFSDCPEYGCYEPGEPDSFGKLHQSAYSLFVLMNLEDWGNTTRQLQKKFTWAWLPVIAFILISSFIMLNLVIAVLCDSLASESENEEEITDDGNLDEEAKKKLKEMKEKKKQEKLRIEFIAHSRVDQLKKRDEKVNTLISEINSLTEKVKAIQDVFNVTSSVSNTTGRQPVLEERNWELIHDFPVTAGFMIHKL